MSVTSTKSAEKEHEVTKNGSKKAAGRPQGQRSGGDGRGNGGVVPPQKHLKMTRTAIADRNRQRARRQRERDSSPAAVQARIEAQEQEAFLREGGPKPGVAKPSIIAAWHRAAKMTPQERRDAFAARQERVEKALRASGKLKPGMSVWISGPADGSGDLDDPDVWLYFPQTDPPVRDESAYEPSEPAEDPDRDGLDVE